MNEETKNLVLDILANRHTPNDVLALLSRHLDNTDNEEDALRDLLGTIAGLSQIIHTLCHLDDKTDSVIDAIVADRSDPFKFILTARLALTDLRSPEFAAKLHADFTQNTNPLDRVWTVEKLKSGHIAVALSGPGFEQRTFAPIGASKEDVDALYNLITARERESKK